MSRAPDKAFNVKLPHDTDKFGELQRLIIDVPKPRTTMLLGHRWTEDPPYAYEGANLTTVENFFVDITKKTLFQGHQAVVFQCDESWTHYTTGKTIVYAKADLDQTSGASVLIASVPPEGAEVGSHMQPTHGEPIPAVRSYVSIRDTLLDKIKGGATSVKTPAGDHKTAKADAGWPYSGPDQISDDATELENAVTALKGESDSRAIGLGLISDKPIALLTATRLVAFAGTGISLTGGSNDAPNDFHATGTKNASLRAGVRVEVSGTASASMHGAVADVAAKGDAGLFSRTTNAIVVGKEVHLGAISASGELGNFPSVDTGKQKDTDNVKIESKVLTSIKSNDKITGEATNKIALKVGSFTIEMTTSSIKVASSAASVEVKASGVEVKMGGSSIKVEAANITLASGGGEVKIGPSGVTVNGMPISLG